MTADQYCVRHKSMSGRENGLCIINMIFFFKPFKSSCYWPRFSSMSADIVLSDKFVTYGIWGMYNYRRKINFICVRVIGCLLNITGA